MIRRNTTEVTAHLKVPTRIGKAVGSSQRYGKGRAGVISLAVLQKASAQNPMAMPMAPPLVL